MSALPLNAPAAERNKEPILTVLRRVLPKTGLVLEIASGTGQHIVHFARELPAIEWQPSDPDPEMHGSIKAWMVRTGLRNVRGPINLDVSSGAWPSHADAVLCINMIHIAPWSATLGLMAGTSRMLPKDGLLYLYGPYRRYGQHTAASNEAFDRDLRSRNPEWGVRDLGSVAEVAANYGLVFEDAIEMPANNLSVIFRQSDSRSRQ
jgi:SAM-dependent methyltransferase